MRVEGTYDGAYPNAHGIGRDGGGDLGVARQAA